MGHAWCEVWQEDTGWKVEESYRCSFCVGKCGEGKSIIGYVAADPKGALPVFEGDRRYTSDVRADNIASVDTDCAETKTVPNGINRCKDPVCLSEPVRGCRVSASIRGRSISMQGKEAVKKSLPELEEADLNWMYDTMMRTMFYKGW